MNNDQTLQLVGRALTAWLGTLFTYSGALKLCLYQRAVQYLEPYTILPEMVSRPARYLLPWIEFATGILLLGGRYPWGQASSLALSSSFVWATISGV